MYRIPKPFQVIAVARTSSLIFIVLDVLKPLQHKKLIEKELEGFGIRSVTQTSVKYRATLTYVILCDPSGLGLYLVDFDLGTVAHMLCQFCQICSIPS